MLPGTAPPHEGFCLLGHDGSEAGANRTRPPIRGQTASNSRGARANVRTSLACLMSYSTTVVSPRKYQMALELRQAGFALPLQTTYNSDGIPLAYAPLGLDLAALLGGTSDGNSRGGALDSRPDALASVGRPVCGRTMRRSVDQGVSTWMKRAASGRSARRR